MSSEIKEKILKELHSLPGPVLFEIEKIIEAFKRGESANSNPSRFDDLFCTISEHDAKKMLDAIEDCEKVETNGW